MTRPTLAFYLCIVLAGVVQADSLHFRLVGRWGPSGDVRGVAVKGEYAYVVGSPDSAYHDGLHVLSLADIAHPVEVWRCTTTALSYDVAVSGEYVYYAEDTAGLRVFSIADPANPVQVARWSEHPAYNVKIRGNFAYVLDTGGLSVVSVADPTHPTEVGRIRRGLHYWRYVDVVGDYAYAAAGLDGVRVISVADPAHPVEVGQYTPGDVRGVAVRDSFAYVGCLSSFRAVSVADPAYPVEVGALDSTSFAGWGILPIRGYVFVDGGMQCGLWAIAVSDPARPTLAGYYGGGYAWYAIAADGDYVFYGGFGLRIFQFYQLGDLDIDNDSLDVIKDTLRLRRWAAAGESLESVRGEFVLANTSASYNPDSLDGPSVSPADSLSVTGSLTGPGGTIDSFVIPNLPSSLVQGQTMVCTLAAYVPVGLRDGDYTGSIYISGKDTAGLWVYESCYVCLQKLGDVDVDNDSLSVVADTVRLSSSESSPYPYPYKGYALGEFVLANTSASYNPDTADGPSRSPVDSLGLTGSLVGPSGSLDSILIVNLPTSLAQGQTIVCTLAVYVPDSVPFGDYAGPLVITGIDSLGCPLAETVYALLKKVPTVVGDLDVDDDSLDVVHDTMVVRAQPGYVPSGTGRFMVVNTTSSYNPDTADGPSRSLLREVKVEVKVEGQNGTLTLDSSAVGIYVLNLPESLAVGQAVECTLAVVLPAAAKPDDYGGWVVISATDTLGFQVQDSFAVIVKGAGPHQNLDSFRVVPIPFKPNQNPEHDAIHFQGLSAGARVMVYDASGLLVWSATEPGDGQLAWKAEVASGIYVYLVVSADGKASKVGKLSVIR